MRVYRKKDFPTADIRRFLEPGPIVLVSSAWKGRNNIMTMGWHMIMAFQPAFIGCYIWDANHSFDMIRQSGECVINIPTFDMIDTVSRVGNTTGAEIDKFAEFGLTAVEAEKVGAPLIKECYANFECKVVDAGALKKHGVFVLEAVKAHVAASPKYPKTVHYRGDGVFMVSGRNVSYRDKFKPQNL
jgi:flavin reductase (DIM6/NTAB) family NADH-FMN oxidoreductase RutF